jgi:FMN phosphatase YigB (HAD superfamily)
MALAIFDLDNTLIDRAGPFRRWAAGFVAEPAVQDSGHAELADEVEWLVAADGDGFTPRPEFIAALRDRYRLTDPAEALLARFRDGLVALVEPDPTVIELLDRLRSTGWRVALATNGNTVQQWAKIRRADLAGRVDAVALSEGVGAANPDRRVFEAAARRCGADLADGGWMVGDCADRDIAGARTLGLRTVWLSRERDWDPATPRPDAIVDRMAEVGPVLLGR